MSARGKKRARGRAYACACGEERFRLTRGSALLENDAGRRPADMAQLGGWTYLFGDCAAGLRLRFQGAKVAASEAIDKATADHARAAEQTKLARRERDPYGELLSGLSEAARARAMAIEAALRERATNLVEAGVEIGEHLLEAQRLFGRRGFTVFLAHIGLDRTRAFRSMQIAKVLRAHPRFVSTSKQMGYEKLAVLARLPEAKQVEVLEHGVPANGAIVPVDRVSYRQINAYVRSLLGKKPQGRKPKTEILVDAKREKWGLPAEIVGPLQAALKALHALKKPAKQGFEGQQRLPVGRLWLQVKRLYWELDQDLGMGELLGDAGRTR